MLATKAQHGACPEMVTPEIVAAAGPVDTVAVHMDLDGLYAGAKWVLGGVEPYPGADADARAVDTRRGEPGPIAARIDRALRASFRDAHLKHRIIQYLVARTKAPSLWEEIEAAARLVDPLLDEAKRQAERYRVEGQVAYVRPSGHHPYDKTELLLLGPAEGAGGGGPRLGVAVDRRRLRVGPGLREDVRAGRGHAHPGLASPSSRLPEVREKLARLLAPQGRQARRIRRRNRAIAVIEWVPMAIERRAAPERPYLKLAQRLLAVPDARIDGGLRGALPSAPETSPPWPTT